MATASKTSSGVKPTSSGLSDELVRFRASTIQRDYTFIASFLDEDLAGLVQPQQILAVSIPQWNFTKASTFKAIYPVAYLTYDSDGWDTKVTIREDAFGSVRTFIDRLVSKIRRPDGLFNAPNAMKILGIQVKILDYSGHIVDIYQLRNLLFMGSEDLMFTHNGSEVMVRELSFHVEDVLRVGNV